MAPRNKILAGLEDALAHVNGETRRAREGRVRVPKHVDVKLLRNRLGLSQADFAHRFGFTVASVRNWEQGVRQPEGPARILLTLIDRIPEQVQAALRRAA
ncbi:helix-turn-helix domain-containing protein [Ferrovibrio sp.]|uniref:helix-turn-helix domain-containing protein n=1 Tax=Ferrovibrio sp. TaxID=1917215 RepID=UPI0025BEF804|nr:helix-turn-helix domain-containing protein [Ferrovibrio sp.]MBX3456678.1 helix-turn-helix domain-containing protein [Ferrovibrio sp.]